MRLLLEVAAASMLGPALLAQVSAGGMHGSERDSTLCFLDREGKLVRTVETSPFSPGLIAVAPDGCIWGAGSTKHAWEPTSEAPVLYRLSPSGEVLNRLLPRNLFGDFPPSAASPDNGGFPALVAGAKSVVLYTPQTRRLYEISLDAMAAFASSSLYGSDGDDLVLSAKRMTGGVEVIRVRLERRYAPGK